jgi:hypothetical protein
MGAWVISAAFLLVVAVSAPARADCMSRCLAPYGCALDYESSHVRPRCSMPQIECEAKCREPGPSFGAIVYSRSTGAVGWSYSFGLEGAANVFALANCARRARVRSDRQLP